MEPVILRTPRLLLRPFSASDGEGLYRILSDGETVKYEPYPPFSREEADAEAARRATDPAFWAVCLPDGTLIGTLFFSDCAFYGAELGYVFSRPHWGNGYAAEAARAVMEHAFATTDLHRVCAMCNPENVRSWRLLERLGMRREGVFRQDIFFSRRPDGSPVWQDTYLYAILRDEFLPPAEQKLSVQ